MGFGKVLREALFGEDRYFRPTVESGQRAPVSGQYMYHADPDPRKIPKWPDPNERFVYLDKGDEAPYLKSFGNIPGVYKLVVECEVSGHFHAKAKSPIGI